MSDSRRPWFPFEADVYLADPNLTLCTLASEGLHARMMAWSHNGEPYGYLTNGGRPITSNMMARLRGVSVEQIEECLKELLNEHRIGKEGDIYYVPKMVRIGKEREMYRVYGLRGGNPNLIKNQTEEKKTPRNPRKQNMPDEDWWKEIKTLYKGVNVDGEMTKMKGWLLTPTGTGRQLTRRFIVNWLNKCDRQVTTASLKRVSVGMAESASVSSLKDAEHIMRSLDQAKKMGDMPQVLSSLRDKYKDAPHEGGKPFVTYYYELWKERKMRGPTLPVNLRRERKV